MKKEYELVIGDRSTLIGIEKMILNACDAQHAREQGEAILEKRNEPRNIVILSVSQPLFTWENQ